MNPNAMNDPLAKLRDIHMPSPVSIWPLAPGWYLLIVIILFTIAVILWQYHKRKQQYRFEAQILSELDSYLLQSPPNWAEINLLLKRAAFLYYPREKIAGLMGEAWLAWLDEQSQSKSYSEGTGRLLLSGPYQVNVLCPDDLHDLLKQTLHSLLKKPGGR